MLKTLLVLALRELGTLARGARHQRKSESRGADQSDRLPSFLPISYQLLLQKLQILRTFGFWLLREPLANTTPAATIPETLLGKLILQMRRDACPSEDKSCHPARQAWR
jgi:hypothetical protein